MPNHIGTFDIESIENVTVEYEKLQPSMVNFLKRNCECFKNSNSNSKKWTTPLRVNTYGLWLIELICPFESKKDADIVGERGIQYSSSAMKALNVCMSNYYCWMATMLAHFGSSWHLGLEMWQNHRLFCGDGCTF